MKNEIRNFYGIISICSLIAAALLGIFWGLSGNIGCAPAVLILGVVFVATLEKWFYNKCWGRALEKKLQSFSFMPKEKTVEHKEQNL